LLLATCGTTIYFQQSEIIGLFIGRENARVHPRESEQSG
jgi:hypothetical protein